MEPFTLTDLNTVMSRLSGHQLTTRLDENHLDAPFDDLGMDSISLVELAQKLGEHGAPFPEEIVEELRTPQLVLDYVNRHRSEP
ncbi:acyl carrier protein [Streptomyces lunalinharesii]|uniref:Carrier domain-containing protein n=1 Tax=Streptomyces lunalinharesii TaxID=333384 RepID=A0ABN3RMJ8_9ACTN